MALTASAAIVVTPDGNWNPDPPAGHAGWNNTSGDKAWVPDENYAGRILLQLTGNAGEYINIVNWEIYDGTDIPFVDDAGVLALDPPNNDPASGFDLVNDRTTRTIWSRIATTPALDEPFFENTGTPWVPMLRATGPRTVIDIESWMKWDVGVGLASRTFEVEAFLPGSFGVPSATTAITVSKPDISLIGGETGAPQPRVD